MLPKPKMLNNKSGGEALVVEIESHPQLKLRFKMMAYIIDVTVNSEFVLSDAQLCKRLIGTVVAFLLVVISKSNNCFFLISEKRTTTNLKRMTTRILNRITMNL